MSTSRRGRPPYDWLPPAAVAQLVVGTALCIETTSRRHDARLLGRVTAQRSRSLSLSTRAGNIVLAHAAIRRARIVESLYEPGDAVLLREVDAATWRGGVVDAQGAEVLVEQIDGGFAWFPEASLEPADARDPVLPPSRRGPVPARVS